MVRLQLKAQWVKESTEALTAVDRAAGVAWTSTVRLGKTGSGARRLRNARLVLLCRKAAAWRTDQ